MSKFEAKTMVNYPNDVVFESFVDVAKETFKNFDEKNPIGSKNKRVYRKEKDKLVYIETELTAYEKNKLYETASVLGESKYKSTYIFNEIDESKTEITLIEEQDLAGFMNKTFFLFQSITGKSKIKKKLNSTGKYLEEKIDKEIRKSKNKK